MEEQGNSLLEKEKSGFWFGITILMVLGVMFIPGFWWGYSLMTAAPK